MPLSVKQLKALQYECDPSIDMTLGEIAAELKINDRTLYNWRQKEDYQDAKRLILKKFRIGILQEAYKALLRNVKDNKEKSALWALENWDDTTDGETTDSSDDSSAIVKALRELAKAD